MDWPRLIGEYGYAAIVLGTFVEGEAVLIAGGFAARHGWLDPTWVFVCGSLGVLISDQAWFYAARCGGRRLLARWPRLRERAETALSAVDRHQAWLAIGFQFAPGTCTVTPIAFGLSRVPALRFLALDVVGIALWSAAMLGLGMASAAAYARLRAIVDADAPLVVAGVALALLWWWLRRRRASAAEVAAARVADDRARG